jgi:hypothetical protein
MRGIFRLLLAAAAAVSAGFIWTVGQAGLAQTNRNLCDLWASLPLPTYKTCAFQNSLVYAALFAAAVLIIWGIGEAIFWFRKSRKRSKAPSEIIQRPEIPLALAPRLVCSFDMNDPGCVHRNVPCSELLTLMHGQPTQYVKQNRCDWYRIRVDAENGNIAGCSGRLLSVKRGGNELLAGENPPLPFTHSVDGNANVHEGVSEFLDLMGVLHDQRIVLAVPANRRSSSIQWNDMFALAGDYEIRAIIIAPSVPAVPIDLLLRWNLQPNSAKIETRSALVQEDHPFAITVGNDPSYYELAGRSLYTLNKLFKIKIENADRAKTLSGCKVSILSIDPFCGYRSPWILRDNFSLPAGDHTLIPLVKYEERREPEKYSEPAMHDTFQIECQNEHKPLLGIESEHRLHIRCTANDVPYMDATIKLSVVGGRMQIEKI